MMTLFFNKNYEKITETIEKHLIDSVDDIGFYSDSDGFVQPDNDIDTNIIIFGIETITDLNILQEHLNEICINKTTITDDYDNNFYNTEIYIDYNFNYAFDISNAKDGYVICNITSDIETELI